MARKSILQDKLDGRTFAVRVGVQVGGGGLKCLNELHTYLRQAGLYAIHPAPAGIYIYTNDQKTLVDCVEKFDLKLLVLPRQTT